MSRYGAAIERDLAHDQIDLAECWRSRRWRKLLNLIDGLDESSAFQEALAQDDEIAAGYVGDDGAPAQYRPRASDWTAQTRLFAAMHDRLGEVVQGLIAMSGNKPPKLDPWPRPEIAATRAQREKSRRDYDELLELVEASKRRTT